MTDTNNIHHLGCFENSLRLTLENCLEKVPEIESLVICGTLKNGDVISCAIIDEDAALFSLIGRLEACKHELVEKIEGLTHDIDYADGA